MEKPKTPICPLMLFFEGDQHKCNTTLCDYSKQTKTCTMKCLKKEVKHGRRKEMETSCGS